MTTVYLAGAITGLNYAQITEWRTQARAVLEQAGLSVVDPVDHQRDVLERHFTMRPVNAEEARRAGLSDRNIFLRDIEDGVLGADRIVAGFPEGSPPSFGSGFEMGVAYMAGIPVYLWAHDEPTHPFITLGVDFVSSNLDDVLMEAITPERVAYFERSLGKSWHVMRTIMRDRQRKYGPKNITDGGVHGLITRILDKIARIREDHKNCPFGGPCVSRTLPDEQRDDAWIDLANYAGPIALSLIHDQWDVPMLEAEK